MTWKSLFEKWVAACSYLIARVRGGARTQSFIYWLCVVEGGRVYCWWDLVHRKYSAETQVAPGNGAFKLCGLCANSASIKSNDHEFHLYIVALQNTGPTPSLALTTFFALCPCFTLAVVPIPPSGIRTGHGI